MITLLALLTLSRSGAVTAWRDAKYGVDLDRVSAAVVLHRDKASIVASLIPSAAEGGETFADGRVRPVFVGFEERFLISDKVDVSAVNDWLEHVDAEGWEVRRLVTDVVVLRLANRQIDTSSDLLARTGQAWTLYDSFQKAFSAKAIEPADFVSAGVRPPNATPLPTLSSDEFRWLQSYWHWEFRSNAQNEVPHNGTVVDGFTGIAGQTWRATIYDFEVDVTVDGSGLVGLSVAIPVDEHVDPAAVATRLRQDDLRYLGPPVLLTPGDRSYSVACKLTLDDLTVGLFRRRVEEFVEFAKALPRH